MNLKNIKTLCLFCVLLYVNAFSHNEFYELDGCTLQEVYATSNINILIWQSYYSPGIPICKNFSLDLPSELFQSTCDDDYSFVALFAWQNVTFEDKIWEPNSPYIRVRFINDPVLFPPPAYGEPDIIAGVWYATNDFGTETDWIVGQNNYNPCVEYRDNWLLLNNREDRLWYWTHNDYIQFDDIFNFKLTLIHELGHELGLAHCSFSSAIMHATPPPAPYFCNYIPQPPDIEGLNIILAQNPITPLVINPLSPFFNRHHSFFEHDPDVLIYSPKNTGNYDNNENSPNQTTLPHSEKNLFTIPKTETYKLEYLEGKVK